MISTMWREINIKVGFGNIRGKLWGENAPHRQKFLAVHGFLDNAGSFDPLMQHFINKDRCVACLEFPGQGLSSPLPRGVVYHPSIEIQAMRTAIQHFGWTKYHLIGHSFGGMRSMMYALSYPGEVETVTSLDAYLPCLDYWTLPEQNPFKEVGRSIDKYLSFENDYHMQSRAYTLEELKEKWLGAAFGFGMESCDLELLLERGAQKTEDGKYVLTRDPFLHNRLNVLGMRHLATVLEAVKDCTESRWLQIRCKNGSPTEQHDFFIKAKTSNDQLATAMPNKMKVVEVEGTHYYHMQHPRETAEIINQHVHEFYDAMDSKL